MGETSALCLRVAALTHVGRRRYVNEDCIAVGERMTSETMSTPWLDVHRLDTPGVCLVADGMGGHPAGDVASRMCIEQLRADLPHAYASDAALVTAIRNANRALFVAMDRNAALTGMGTTLAGIVVGAEDIAVINVGDSRVYRIGRGNVEQISIDDSETVGSWFFSWQFTSRALNQCLGGYPGMEEITPHIARVPTAPGCEFLICSDGLHDMLSDHAIHASLDADPAQSVLALFENAMEQGGIDNISIILARVEALQPHGL
jgi:PPM family protein phosphatase